MESSDLQPKPGNGFPTKAAGAIAIAVGILAGAHWYGDHSRGWDPATFTQAWIYRMPHRPSPLIPTPPVTNAHTHHRPGQLDAISPFLLDDHDALDPFFRSLWQLEQQKDGSAPSSSAAATVTILHYGDSPTTADLITGDMRDHLQQRFGNAGEGFNLTAKPWAWYGHRHVDLSDADWASSQKDATGVGRYKRGDYGLGGAIFAGNTGAHTTYTLRGEAQGSVIVHYLAYPGGGSFAVSAGATPLGTVDTNAETKAVVTKQFTIPAEASTLSIRVVSGTVKHYGVDFRTGKSGVLYDSLGLNGATTTVLSRTMDPQLLMQSLHAAQPQLIIINYGTNESQFAGLVTTLEKELTAAITNIRMAAPGVPILIMSPMDRGDRHGGEITTKVEIPQIVAIQKKVAAQQNCAFFDTYDAMGGEGTVARWYDAEPRLMTADLIHPTPPGALIVATLLEKNLYAGYDRWKRIHGIAVSPKTPPPPSIPKPHPGSVLKSTRTEPAPASNDVAPNVADPNKTLNSTQKNSTQNGTLDDAPNGAPKDVVPDHATPDGAPTDPKGFEIKSDTDPPATKPRQSHDANPAPPSSNSKQQP